MRVRISPGLLKIKNYEKDDTLKKEITTKDVNGISSSEQECELCGSHGSVTFSVNCECGKYHSIEINSW